MRRTILTTLIAAGAAITLLTGSSLFAGSTDRASTGDNKFQTKGRVQRVDLQLATWNEDSLACEGWSEHLTTAVITATDVDENLYFTGNRFCLRNNSPTATAAVTVKVLDLLDVDFDCTGDEPAVDATCGGDQVGELLTAPLGMSFYRSADCSNYSGDVSRDLRSFTTPQAFTNLTAGQVICLSAQARYVPSEDAAAKAQSDRVTWKFVFDASIAPSA